jgi:hypothetical protein
VQRLGPGRSHARTLAGGQHHGAERAFGHGSVLPPGTPT